MKKINHLVYEKEHYAGEIDAELSKYKKRSFGIWFDDDDDDDVTDDDGDEDDDGDGGGYICTYN